MKNKKITFIVSLLSIFISLSIPVQVLADDAAHETTGAVEFYYSDSSSVPPSSPEETQKPIPESSIKAPNINKLPQTGEEELALYFKIGMLSTIVGIYVFYKKKTKSSDY